MLFRKLIAISRPRFWIYTVGPFLVGIAATGAVVSYPAAIQSLIESQDMRGLISLGLLGGVFIAYLLYFIFPANLLIYGVNDIADGDTDQHNNKKQGYESRLTLTTRQVVRSIGLRSGLCALVVVICVIAMGINEAYSYKDLSQGLLGGLLPDRRLMAALNTLPWLHLWIGTLPVRVAFLFASVFYSLSPIRAKARPFIDGLFNMLYIIPGLIAYVTFGGSYETISRVGFAAGRLWCIAMHTYSAIPDITPDQQAGLTTTAVLLGRDCTLIYCGVVRSLASVLGYSIIGRPSLIFGVVYVLLTMLAWRTDVMKVYTYFPRINAVVGFVLFWLVVFL